ncbi:hypothetical protein SO802_017944 [Lithocarpus litseifolius]|uniref:Uncharacterized protein n=1 Tax=Lithocarpus litseifolius TaxID=425828 RepID=A0AAW2CJB7_9ROSI
MQQWRMAVRLNGCDLAGAGVQSRWCFRWCDSAMLGCDEPVRSKVGGGGRSGVASSAIWRCFWRDSVVLLVRQESASPAATSVQLSLPHSAAASAPGDAASAATLVLPSMPHSAVARASERPRQALDQARQVNQLLADVGTYETQIEASSRNPKILPCVLELKNVQFHLNDNVAYLIYVQKQCVVLFFVFLQVGERGFVFYYSKGELYKCVYKKYIDDEK